MIYPSYLKEWKLIRVLSLFVLHKIKKTVIHIRALKQALNHGLKLAKVHRIIQFDQEAWLKPYIVMNTELRKHKKWFWKRFFQADE